MRPVLISKVLISYTKVKKGNALKIVPKQARGNKLIKISGNKPGTALQVVFGSDG